MIMRIGQFFYIRRAQDFRGTRRKQYSASWGPLPCLAFSFPMSLREEQVGVVCSV